MIRRSAVSETRLENGKRMGMLPSFRTLVPDTLVDALEMIRKKPQ